MKALIITIQEQPDGTINLNIDNMAREDVTAAENAFSETLMNNYKFLLKIGDEQGYFKTIKFEEIK